MNKSKTAKVSFKLMALLTAVVLIATVLFVDVLRVRNTTAASINLPEPTELLNLTQKTNPLLLRGLELNPDNPFEFGFIIDEGDSKLSPQDRNLEIQRLIKYFLAAVTIPQEDMWVNLSPYESDRIIPSELGSTEMGRDMMAQDYILKQLSSSLTHPDTKLGDMYWNMSNIASDMTNDFRKIWISPALAEIYEEGTKVFVGEASLKVQSENDYFASTLNKGNVIDRASDLNKNDCLGLIIDEIEKEVNNGEHFKVLRQMYHSLILATWFKLKVRNSIYDDLYVSKNKTSGINSSDKKIKDKIYALYMDGFKKGVYDILRKDESKKNTHRRYFSGGLVLNTASAIELIDTKPKLAISNSDSKVTCLISPISSSIGAGEDKHKKIVHKYAKLTSSSLVNKPLGIAKLARSIVLASMLLLSCQKPVDMETIISTEFAALQYDASTGENFYKITQTAKTAEGKDWFAELHRTYNKALADYKKGKISTSKITRIQGQYAQSLAAWLDKKFAYKMGDAYLPRNFSKQETDCFGFAQMFYVLANSIGLSADIVELYPVLPDKPQDQGHSIAFVNLANGKKLPVDATLKTTNKLLSPVDLSKDFEKRGDNYLLTRKDNPIGVDRMINIMTPDRILACIELRKGQSAEWQHDRNNALSFYKQSIEKDSTYATPYSNIAGLMIASEEYDSAFVYLDKAKSLFPELHVVHVNNAAVFLNLGNFDSAKVSLSEALRWNPKSPTALEYMAITYKFEGSLDSSIAYYSRLLELVPSMARIYLDRADLYLSKGDKVNGLKDILIALRLDPALRRRADELFVKYKIEKGSSSITSVEELIEQDIFAGFRDAKIQREMTGSGVAELLEMGFTDEQAREYGYEIGFQEKTIKAANVATLNADIGENLLDRRPIDSGLLSVFTVGLDMAVKQSINADNKLKLGGYVGSGFDVSNFLLSTNVDELWFIDSAYDFEGIDIENYTVTEILNDKTAALYKREKFYTGYGRSELADNEIGRLLVPSEFSTLLVELSAIGVSEDALNSVRQQIIDQRGSDGLKITFNWAYPGETTKIRTLHLIKGNVFKSEAYSNIPKLDIWYQRAGLTMYRNYDQVLPHLIEKLNINGTLVLDPHTPLHNTLDSNDEVFKELGVVSKEDTELMNYWNKQLDDFIKPRRHYGYDPKIFKLSSSALNIVHSKTLKDAYGLTDIEIRTLSNHIDAFHDVYKQFISTDKTKLISFFTEKDRISLDIPAVKKDDSETDREMKTRTLSDEKSITGQAMLINGLPKDIRLKVFRHKLMNSEILTFLKDFYSSEDIQLINVEDYSSGRLFLLGSDVYKLELLVDSKKRNVFLKGNPHGFKNRNAVDNQIEKNDSFMFKLLSLLNLTDVKSDYFNFESLIDPFMSGVTLSEEIIFEDSNELFDVRPKTLDLKIKDEYRKYKDKLLSDFGMLAAVSDLFNRSDRKIAHNIYSGNRANTIMNSNLFNSNKQSIFMIDSTFLFREDLEMGVYETQTMGNAEAGIVHAVREEKEFSPEDFTKFSQSYLEQWRTLVNRSIEIENLIIDVYGEKSFELEFFTRRIDRDPNNTLNVYKSALSKFSAKTQHENKARNSSAIVAGADKLFSSKLDRTRFDGSTVLFDTIFKLRQEGFEQARLRGKEFYRELLLTGIEILELNKNILNDSGISAMNSLKDLTGRMAKDKYKFNETGFAEIKKQLLYIPTTRDPKTWMVKDIPYEDVDLINLTNFNQRFMLDLHFELMSRCSNNCFYCAHGKPEGKQKAMPFMMYAKIIDHLNKYDLRVYMMPYEHSDPFEYFDSSINATLVDVFNYYNYVMPHNNHSILTNGSAGNPRLAQYVAENLKVMWSLSFQIFHKTNESYYKVLKLQDAGITDSEKNRIIVEVVDYYFKKFSPLIKAGLDNHTLRSLRNYSFLQSLGAAAYYDLTREEKEVFQELNDNNRLMQMLRDYDEIKNLLLEKIDGQYDLFLNDETPLYKHPLAIDLQGRISEVFNELGIDKQSIITVAELLEKRNSAYGQFTDSNNMVIKSDGTLSISRMERKSSRYRSLSELYEVYGDSILDDIIGLLKVYFGNTKPSVELLALLTRNNYNVEAPYMKGRNYYIEAPFGRHLIGLDLQRILMAEVNKDSIDRDKIYEILKDFPIPLFLELRSGRDTLDISLIAGREDKLPFDPDHAEKFFPIAHIFEKPQANNSSSSINGGVDLDLSAYTGGVSSSISPIHYSSDALDRLRDGILGFSFEIVEN